MIQTVPNYTTGAMPITPSRLSWMRSRASVPPGARTGLLGLGDGAVPNIVISAPSIAGTAATGAIFGSAGTASTATLWGLSAAVAIPVIGAVVAGVTLGLVALFARRGPKQRVATTLIVDKVEPLLAQNRDGYLSGPRTVSSQAQALANFDAGWQYVVEHCGIPEMGDPGKRCISERQRGGQWDWFFYYREPIENDPEVVPDGSALSYDPDTGQIVGVARGGAGNYSGLLVAAALVGVYFLVGRD